MLDVLCIHFVVIRNLVDQDHLSVVAGNLDYFHSTVICIGSIRENSDELVEIMLF